MISIENVTLMGRNADIEEIEKLANEITVPAIGCRIKITDCPIPEHEDLLQKVKAGITQVDIVETGLTKSLSALAASGVLLPLDDLLAEYGRDLLEKEGRLLHATTIDGQVYALPANLYCGKADGIGYNADIAEKYGIEVPPEVNMEQLTIIGENLKEKGSSVYLTTQGDGSLTMFDSFYETELFSGDAVYGVILNPTENTKIVNLFETEEYRAYLKIIKEWKDKGLIPSDTLLSGKNGQEMFNNEEVFFQFSSVSPQTVMNTPHKGLAFEERYVPIVRNRLTTRQAQEFAWGITKGCLNPDKAMALLNLIYTNTDLCNLLQYGRAGIDYELIGENTIRTIEGTEQRPRYSSYFSIFGDSALMYQYETDYGISMDDIREFAAQSQETLTFGYVFQTDAVAGETGAVFACLGESHFCTKISHICSIKRIFQIYIISLKMQGPMF